MCEPILELPKHINIQIVAEIEKKSKQTLETTEDNKPKEPESKSTYEVKSDFRVLPTFTQKERLRSVLSLDENEYLRCKFHEYIANKELQQPFKIIPAYEINVVKPKPRRFSLTGRFYGTDNKLAPVPVMADPRQYTKNMQKKKFEPKKA